MAEKLDKNLVHFSEKIKEFLGKDISRLKGAGAAGGLGAGLFAFLSAELRPGFEIVKELVHLEEYVKWADLVITGEGKMDNQTRYGKAPYGVAKTAKKYGKSVIAVTGALGEDVNELYHQSFDCLFPIADRPMKSEESIRRAPELLTNAGKRIMHLLRTGMLLKYNK
jgi:glycerate kinase